MKGIRTYLGGEKYRNVLFEQEGVKNTSKAKCSLSYYNVLNSSIRGDEVESTT